MLKQHVDDVIGFGISCNGKYILSCSKSTDLVLWDLKGQMIANVDTYLMNNYCGRISPCGRFIAASGKTFNFCSLSNLLSIFF